MTAAECPVSMVPVTSSPVHACAGKAGREFKIDWFPRGYSPLRLPAGTIVTFKYRAGGGAALLACRCAHFCERLLLMPLHAVVSGHGHISRLVQLITKSYQDRLAPRLHAGVGYGSGRCSYKATFARNARRGGSLSVKIPKGSPDTHGLVLWDHVPCRETRIRLGPCSQCHQSGFCS